MQDHSHKAKIAVDHILQHRLVNRQIGHDLLQLAVVFLEQAEPLHLDVVKSAYFLRQK